MFGHSNCFRKETPYENKCSGKTALIEKDCF